MGEEVEGVSCFPLRLPCPLFPLAAVLLVQPPGLAHHIHLELVIKTQKVSKRRGQELLAAHKQKGLQRISSVAHVQKQQGEPPQALAKRDAPRGSLEMEGHWQVVSIVPGCWQDGATNGEQLQ